ncbi:MULTISPECIES: chorismate mutase [unclassified Marinobacterium]|jgi:chorismate mutase-like protein|uniref:chorismate mutase n=1 Tax=unclassified Marinobacterium TaxID=2644139 RepID=UPI001569473A|nr:MULTISPECIES: chorismate mutase [unclassified Marinobacterium]NRP47039.1 hypothetical protein [Marinobacterium sp. xm-d-543]NRQ22996.1 hypothetical protein [Marinobacterium sp. xm-m-312]
MDQQNLYQGLTQDEALTQVRDEIDQIDQEIHALLNKRAECAQRVADIKHNFGANSPVFYRPEREAQVLRKAMQRNQGPLPDQEIARLFREVMSVCLAHEHRMNVGFVSTSELDTEQAALKQFGHSVEPIAFASASETLLSLAQGALHYAVLSVNRLPEVLSLLVTHQLNVVGEVTLHGDEAFLVLGHQEVSASGDDKTALIVESAESVVTDSKRNITDGSLTYMELDGARSIEQLQSMLGPELNFHYLGLFPKAVF